ncbi:MAG: Holliday junction branch migration protein RuvA [Candidatus Babeliales bacterium]
MVDYLNGSIKEIAEQSIIVDIGNIGIMVQVPSGFLFQIGKQVTVHTYLHWNQEQGPTMFGFTSVLDRHVFLIIISCTGIGPKIALAVLHDLSAKEFLSAVQTEDDSVLSKVNGIGTKKAEQMIVQLKHKVAKLITQGVELDDAQDLRQWHEISQALESLNYSRTEVSRAMNHLKKSHEQIASFDQLLRKALSFLAK